jgi:histidinol-phosphate aminotransferase
MITRESYRQLELYEPNRVPCRIDLSDNTNLWGIPPAAERVLRSIASPVITRYPTVYAQALKAALASYVGATPEQLVTGCGSDDILDSAIRAFTEPGDTLAFPDPTFTMLPLFAHMNGLKPAAVPLKADWDIDADALLATGAKVIYVCAPNNPTGTMISQAALERLAREAPGVVLVDEAYAEFTDKPVSATLRPEGKLVFVRTLSKAFGLAGLRVGWAVGGAALGGVIENSRGPYKFFGLPQHIAG